MAFVHTGFAQKLFVGRSSLKTIEQNPKKLTQPPSFRNTSIGTWLLFSAETFTRQTGFSQKLLISVVTSANLIQGSLSTLRPNENLGNRHEKHNNFPSVIGTNGETPTLELCVDFAPKNVGKQMDCAQCVTVPNHREAAKANSCLFASHLSLNNGHTVICHSSPALARRARSICASARFRKLRSPRMIYIRRWNKSRRHLEILIAAEERQQHDSMQPKINLCSSVM